MEQTQQYASLFVDDLGEGGSGLPDDFDFEITDAKTVNYDFGAAKGGVRPCLQITMNGVDYEEPIINYYSVGKAADWMITPDGKGFKGLQADDQRINKNSNVGQYVLSLANSGYPTVLIKGGDLTILKGIKGHAKRLAATNREGLDAAKDKRGNPAKMLLVTAVTFYPGMDGKAAGTTASAGTSSDELTDLAVDVVSTLIKASPTGIAKGDLPKQIFDYAKKKKIEQRNDLVRIASEDSFLGDGPWAYENGIVKALA